MYEIGKPEIDAVAKVIRSGKLFRYDKDSECDRFEQRYAKFLGVKHVRLGASGSAAIAAALGGLGIGPGDEVLVPAHTYMATAIAVVAVGAIPVIVDIDESLMIAPEAMDDAVGPRTRAVIPVHMRGSVCDMDAIMKIARKRKLFVVEDACQCVGGGYEGKMVGSIGHAGTFSFNFYKNITCGEGGAIVTNDGKLFERASCMIDCGRFFWSGKEGDFEPFASNGSRASEFEGALLNTQLDRLGSILRRLRKQKKQVLAGTHKSGLVASPCHSLDYECGSTVMFLLPTAAQAVRFRAEMGAGAIAGDTGRHTYNFWDPILKKRGAHHPAMDPFKMPQNRKCRMKYSADMLPHSLNILNRTLMLGMNPDRTERQLKEFIAQINRAAAAVLTR